MKQDDLIKQITQRLDEKNAEPSEQLDNELQQARRAALASRQRRSFSQWLSDSLCLSCITMPLKVSAVSLAVVLATLLVVLQPAIQQEESLPIMADVELLLDDDNLELYENLEFYEWLLYEETYSG